MNNEGCSLLPLLIIHCSLLIGWTLFAKEQFIFEENKGFDYLCPNNLIRNCNMEKEKIILTGDRPTGKLHIGFASSCRTSELRALQENLCI